MLWRVQVPSTARFHAYSGCDTTSSFNGQGKKSAWQASHAYEDATEVFVHMAKHPYQLLDVDSDLFQKLERPTVIVYDRASPLTSINQTRRELFCYKNHAVEKLPPSAPTQDALLQHIRRAMFQAGTWTTSTQSISRELWLGQRARVVGTSMDNIS